MGRGQEDARRARGPTASATPLALFDCGFSGLGEDGTGHELATAAGKDRRAGYFAGVAIEAEGDRSYVRATVRDFLDELGSVSMEIHSDGEPAPETLANGGDKRTSSRS